MKGEGKNLIIGSDHAGFIMKQIVKEYLISLGHNVVDVGTYTEESCDYPDYAHKVAENINSGKFKEGILLCGSGNGVCMVANKYPNIRAALCWNEEIAKFSKLHNNANILCLPARYIGEKDVVRIVDVFLNTDFEGGRHQRRIEKINIA